MVKNPHSATGPTQWKRAYIHVNEALFREEHGEFCYNLSEINFWEFLGSCSLMIRRLCQRHTMIPWTSLSRCNSFIWNVWIYTCKSTNIFWWHWETVQLSHCQEIAEYRITFQTLHGNTFEVVSQLSTSTLLQASTWNKQTLMDFGNRKSILFFG